LSTARSTVAALSPRGREEEKKWWVLLSLLPLLRYTM